MKRTQFSLCKCGCGKFTKTKAARYLVGHNGKGRIRPEAERKRISESMKLLITTEIREKRALVWKGRRHTEKSKLKMSIAAKKREIHKKETGWTHSSEARSKISKAHKGRIFSEETKKKISEAQKGKVIPETQRTQISSTLKQHYSVHENPFKGKQHSKESKELMRQANLGKFRGENGPNWQGGVSSLPYGIEWTPWLREEIRTRDNFLCKYCKKKSKSLDIHHIDFNKNHNFSSNLISLCKSCHGKANRGSISKIELLESLKA